MSTNQIVDLSADDCNDEILRKKINRKKMYELKRYIPFLEYISNRDPIKNINYKHLLRWLSINNEFPARMAATCENNIIAKYNKIKSTMEIPAHIAEVFIERDAILISDEDDEQPTTTKQCTEQLSTDLETIDLEDYEPKDILSEDNHGLQKSSCMATHLPTSIANTSATDDNSTSTKQSLHKNSKDSFRKFLEEGEILSDEDGVKENRAKKETPPKSAEKMTISISVPASSLPNEDEIINKDLLRRIDCFDDDSNANQTQTQSNKENEDEADTSTTRHKSSESGIFSRRSPKTTRSNSLSTLCSEDSPRASSHKKKKKKRKHKKKNHDIENHSRRGKEESANEKRFPRTTSDHVEGKTRKPKKTSKKKSKADKQFRSLSISDDEEDAALTNRNNKETNLPTDSKQKNEVLPSVDLNELPTVVLSDSNDEEPGDFCEIQETNTEPTPAEPDPQRVEPICAIESASNTEPKSQSKEKTVQSAIQPIQDIKNMDLNELNDIYSKLCDATGIQLEELLIDLVGKSAEENKQSPQVDLDQISETLEQINYGMERNLPQETFNHNNCGNNSEENIHTYRGDNANVFAFQQNQMQYQNQCYQMAAYNHRQQEMQRQSQLNVQCQVPVQLPYQHTLRRGLNLNDPRIVQRLKQIKDSPIHNLSIRESASLLMNRHVASMPKRPVIVPEITSKTATTYGEHKRLRELERKRELDRQASKTSTITTNHVSDSLHAGDNEVCSIQKKKVVKNNVERIERHALESSVEETFHKVIETVESTEKPVHQNRPSRRSSSMSERSVEETFQKVIETVESTEKPVHQNRPSRRSSSMSEDSLSTSEKRTKSKENIASGRITPFEMEKVVSIVLSAIGPVNDDTSKKLRELSTLQFESRSSICKDDNEQVESLKKSNSVDLSVENDNNARDATTVTVNSMKKRKGRQTSKNCKENSKKSPSKPAGSRELNNLNCTFLDYQEIFQKNCLETNAGKRRCIILSNATRELSADDLSQSSNDTQSTLSHKMTVAPINRRRQTCSALQDSENPKKDHQPPLKVVLRRLSEGGTFGIENAESVNCPSEVCEKETRNQRQPIQLVQQVKIKLKRLSIDEIKTKKGSVLNSKNYSSKASGSQARSSEPRGSMSSSSGGIGSQEDPILIPISCEPVESTDKTNPKPLRHPNTNVNMTMNSTRVCAICNKRSVDLTSHYVIQHKTESYVSRLTAEEILNLESQIKLATLNRKRYKITCVFCQDELEVSQFVQFHAHYSYHTGEYGFKCDVCEVVKPYREDIKSHQLRTSKCRNAKVRANYLYKTDLRVIYLYICKLCNFVQLNKANIEKHQRDHHCFRFDEPEHVKEIIICALDDVRLNNESSKCLPPNEMESIESGGVENEEDYSESSGEAVLQEQEFLHEYPLDIKDVMINVDNENKLQDEGNKSDDFDKGNRTSALATLNSDNAVTSSSSPVTSGSTHTIAQVESDTLSNNVTNKKTDKVTSAIEPSNSSVQLKCTMESDDCTREQCANSNLDVTVQLENDKAEYLSTSLSPETLLGQLHGVEEQTNIITVIHRSETKPCIESHQPYEEIIDIKPDVNEIKVENSEEVVEVEVSEPSPWPVTKQILYRKIAPGINYFGLYKCMVSECWYSTNEAEKYIRHVDTHKANGQNLILYCAYCSSRSTCPQQSVRHIRTRHSMSLYQCSVCTYRSIHAGNVSLHIEINHTDTTEEKCIFKCVGRVRSMENKIAGLKEKIKENINRFVCRDCPAQYYSLSLMKLHLEAAQHRASVSNFAKYACIFCGQELYAFEEMRVHLAISHPNDICYVVERELINATDEDSVENLKYYNINPPVAGVKVRVAEFKEEEPEAAETANKVELNLIERIIPLLELITESTGVYHSELYKCTVCAASFFTYELWLNHIQSRHNIIGKVNCPYCPELITLEEAKGHFESHVRHAFICLHCIKTFGSKPDLLSHFHANHGNFEKCIERPISCSNFKKYYIMKGEESFPTNWIPILRSFHEGLRNRCIEELYQNRCSEWWCDFCFDDVDMPQFIPDSGTIFKCLVNSCGLELSDESAFDLHLNQHTVPSSYDCRYCVQTVDTKWECIKNHYMLHRCNTSYMCCVCKFIHHNRLAVTEHINKNHNSRDVPIITLWRDATKCKTSMSIVVPANKLRFATITSCFCCGLEMTNGKGLIRHLTEAHGIVLCLKCELCGDILLTHGEVERHCAKHESTEFIIRYEILSPSQHKLCISSILPFRIDVKQKIEKRICNVEAASPNKRIKLDENICLNIKQELTKDDGEDDKGANDSSSQKPICSIKCVKIDQLVSSTCKATPSQPARGSKCIKPIEDNQMPTFAPYSSNMLNYYMQNNNNLSADKNVPSQTATYSNSNIHPRYNVPSEQAAIIALQSIPYPPPPSYPNYNTQSARVISNPNQLAQSQQPQIIPIPPATTSVIEYYSNNTMQSTVYPQIQQFEPTQNQPSLPTLATQHQSSLPTHRTPSLPALAAQFGSPTLRPQLVTDLRSPNSMITIQLPNNQGVATISRSSPYTTPSYKNGPHCSYQNSETVASSRPIQMNSGFNTTNPVQPQKYNQPMQTMEHIAKTIDFTCPELVPICGSCNLECTSFVTLLSHFQAVHESKLRFLFRIERRVECVYCPYRGSIASFAAHNSTFHPGKNVLCRSVIDHSRCGVCHAIFSFIPSANSTSHPKCNCPRIKRLTADCINIDTLKLLQKYGKKCVGFMCPTCKKLFQFEMGCTNHIQNIHNQLDVLPQIWPLKGLLFACYLCERTEMTMQNLIIHINVVHMISNSTCTLENRLSCYKKIKLIYPRGLMVSLSDLSNAGYDEETLKNDIQIVDAIPRN